MDTPHKNCIVCGSIFYNLRLDKKGHRIRKYTKEKWVSARFCSFSCRNQVVKNRLGKVKEEVTYSGLHKWIYRHLGKFPSQCEYCGKIGEKENGDWNIQFANKSGLYRRSKKDWLRLCVKCHREHDKNIRLATT